MRLPQKKKAGDPVLASDWNLLLDAIAARTPRSGAGLELIASSGGFAYSRPSALSSPQAGLPPFSVIGIEKKNGNYLVTVKEGWVIERKPKSDNSPAIKFHMPKSGDKPLDSIPRPQISMSIGETLWCKFSTKATGEIEEEPELIASSEDKDGNHYKPEDPEGSGSEGEYYIKLFKLEDDGGSPTVKVYQQSDIEHWAQLWTGENLGPGAMVYKEYNEDDGIYNFRTIHHREDDDEIERQIEVEEEDEVVRIKGNAKKGKIYLYSQDVEPVDLLEWKDGLVVTDQNEEEFPFQFELKKLMVCVDGTPEELYFVTYTPPDAE